MVGKNFLAIVRHSNFEEATRIREFRNLTEACCNATHVSLTDNELFYRWFMQSQFCLLPG
jgi:hypothetical protein